ncbi:MAG: hypothetical protein GXO77_11390, partial [Calditrichaeota bacterium]|nr:hypothetical protein [Calditrichota bacterium]
MKRSLTILLLLCLAGSPAFLRAGDFESNLTKVLSQSQAKDYLKGYVQPFSNALGTALGGALFHRAYSKTLPRFDIGVSAVFVPIPGEDLTFVLNPPPEASYTSKTLPTIFGDDNPTEPGAVPGINQDRFLLPMLHANIGLFGNFEATIRFAKVNLGDYGDLAIYGGGIKYELSDLIPIPMFPIDFGVQAAYHKFTLGEFLDAGTFSMNLQASGSIPILPIDIYGGV